MQDVGFSFSKNCITIWFQTVLDVFEAEIEATALSCSRDGPLEIAADGRCDSPGHCALYGIVTLLWTAELIKLWLHLWSRLVYLVRTRHFLRILLRRIQQYEKMNSSTCDVTELSKYGKQIKT